MSLEELFGGRLDIPAAMEQMRQAADSLGLPFGKRSHTYNSRNAQELGLWAAELGQFKSYECAVYRAYFVDGVNIGQTDNLLQIATNIGLDPGAAKEILDNHLYAAEIDKEWDQAVSAGVRAIPTLRCEGRELVGFQSLEMYTSFFRDTC